MVQAEERGPRAGEGEREEKEEKKSSRGKGEEEERWERGGKPIDSERMVSGEVPVEGKGRQRGSPGRPSGRYTVLLGIFLLPAGSGCPFVRPNPSSSAPIHPRPRGPHRAGLRGS